MNKMEITDSKDAVLNINSLPEEIIVEIFKYLTQNELGQVASVCRRFNECTRCPVLWKEVDVKFSWYEGSQNEISSIFVKNLSSSVTHMKLEFGLCRWKGLLNFEELCVTLKERCPCLETLKMHCALFSCSLSSVIDLCSEFLPNLTALLLPHSRYENKGIKYQQFLHKMEVCKNVAKANTHSVLKRHYLKKLSLFTADNWFFEDRSFLNQLEVLHLGWTSICSRFFRILQDHAVNLIELFLCASDLNDDDLSLMMMFDSVFPQLKTICLVDSFYVTCDGIVSLVQACPSLQNVYVDRDVAEWYANDPFVTANISKLGIVKTIHDCDHETRFFA